MAQAFEHIKGLVCVAYKIERDRAVSAVWPVVDISVASLDFHIMDASQDVHNPFAISTPDASVSPGPDSARAARARSADARISCALSSAASSPAHPRAEPPGGTAERTAKSLLQRLVGTSPTRMVAEPGMRPPGLSAHAAPRRGERYDQMATVPTNMENVLLRRMETIENTMFRRIKDRCGQLEHANTETRDAIMTLTQKLHDEQGATPSLENRLVTTERQITDLYSELDFEKQASIRRAQQIQEHHERLEQLEKDVGDHGRRLAGGDARPNSTSKQLNDVLGGLMGDGGELRAEVENMRKRLDYHRHVLGQHHTRLGNHWWTLDCVEGKLADLSHTRLVAERH